MDQVIGASGERIECPPSLRTPAIAWSESDHYNLGSLWRRLVLPQRIGNWSLTSLQQWLIKTGGRLVKHAQYYWLLLVEGHLTRRLFGAMLCRIALHGDKVRARRLQPPAVLRACLKALRAVSRYTFFKTPSGRPNPCSGQW